MKRRRFFIYLGCAEGVLPIWGEGPRMECGYFSWFVAVVTGR